MAYCSYEVSRKFRILSFLATVSVVIIHTNHLEGCVDVPLAWWMGNVIGYLQRWAVPYFFLVSGFFFERSFRIRGIWPHWVEFLKKKCHTLLVPYLLWGIVYGSIVMTLLQVGVAYQRGGDEVFAGTIFERWGHWSFVDSLLGITHAPLIGALWYIRVLLIIFITAPFWICLERISRWLILALSLPIIICSPISGMYEESFAIMPGVVFHLKVNAIGWVLMGMVLSAFDVDKKFICNRSWGIGIVAIVIWVASALLPLLWAIHGEKPPIAVNVLHQVHPLFAIMALWHVVEFLSHRMQEKLPWVFTLGFWIYCMHHPITGYVGALGHIVLGRSLAARFVMQFSSWAITLIVCIVLAYILKKAFPRTYDILCGGR